MNKEDKSRAVFWLVIERIFICLALFSLARGWWPEITQTLAFLGLAAGTHGLAYCDR